MSPLVHAVADELAQARREARARSRAGCRAAGSPAGGSSPRSSSSRCRRAPRRLRVRAAAVPEAAVPDEHAAAAHLGRDRCRARRRTPGCASRRCEPGMMRVAPFSSVKSVSAHIELHTVGDVRLRRAGCSWSSAWIGCAPRRGGSRSTRATRPGTRDRARPRRSAARVGGPGSPRSAGRARAGCTPRLVSVPRTSLRAKSMPSSRSSRARSASSASASSVGNDVLDDRVAVALDPREVS